MKNFFKVIGIIIGSIVGLILIIILYYTTNSKIEENIKDKVKITISYNTINCKPEYPLYINIFNGTNRIILDTSFNIGVYQPGYSSNIISYSSYDYRVDTDKIIQPGGNYDFCRIVPSLSKNDVSINNLIYDISSKYIRFQK